MQISNIIAELDSEINRLRQARALLSGESKLASKHTDKAGSKPAYTGTSPKGTQKRNLTPEGRKKISDAVRRRWALQKAVAR